MENITFKIKNIPAVVYGKKSEKVCIFIHGQGGNKEEAEFLSKIICEKEWQILSIDLHSSFLPWNVVPELKEVIKYVEENWKEKILYANSIGAWFSLLSFTETDFKKCFFVSPVLNMENLIKKMMLWAGVTEERLEKEKLIPTSFGQTLSWEYLIYAKENKTDYWKSPVYILYAENDNLIEYETIKEFSEKFTSDITIMKNGEHWFHTSEQLNFLTNWLKQIL